MRVRDQSSQSNRCPHTTQRSMGGVGGALGIRSRRPGLGYSIARCIRASLRVRSWNAVPSSLLFPMLDPHFPEIIVAGAIRGLIFSSVAGEVWPQASNHVLGPQDPASSRPVLRQDRSPADSRKQLEQRSASVGFMPRHVNRRPRRNASSPWARRELNRHLSI